MIKYNDPREDSGTLSGVRITQSLAGPQKQGHTHSIPLLPWPRLPQSECLPHRGEQSESAWRLRLRTDGIFCPRMLAGGYGIDGAVRHRQQSEWRSSRRQRSLLYSRRDMWPIMAKKLPGSAVGGKASEDRPVKGTAHILVFFLAGSPEFPSGDGFSNRLVWGGAEG